MYTNGNGAFGIVEPPPAIPAVVVANGLVVVVVWPRTKFDELDIDAVAGAIPPTVPVQIALKGQHAMWPA